MQYAVLSTNSKLEAVLFGPFTTLRFAKTCKKRLEKAYSNASHLVLNFQSMDAIPKLKEYDNATVRSSNTGNTEEEKGTGETSS